MSNSFISSVFPLEVETTIKSLARQFYFALQVSSPCLLCLTGFQNNQNLGFTVLQGLLK